MLSGESGRELCAIEAAAGTSGNISVRADNYSVEGFPEEGFRKKSHHKLDGDFQQLNGNRFLVTGSGKNLRYISERPHSSLALIEMVTDGYDILWGLKKDDVITSEHPAHFTTYQSRPGVKAFIHAQPTSVNVLTRLFRNEDSLNSLLFVQHEQLKIYCPAALAWLIRLSTVLLNWLMR